MIGSVTRTFIEDVSRPNEALKLAVPADLRLSALVWTTLRSGSTAAARGSCLRYALGEITANLTNPQLWVIAGHEAVQPDNRITRHRGFWNSLAAQGLKMPGEDRMEHIQHVEGGLRFVGGARFTAADLEQVDIILRSVQGAILVLWFENARQLVSHLLAQGWALRNTNPPAELLRAVYQQSAMVVSVYGEFDDPDVAVAAIGRKETLDRLIPSNA